MFCDAGWYILNFRILKYVYCTLFLSYIIEAGAFITSLFKNMFLL
jgi:hypothetical protein